MNKIDNLQVSEINFTNLGTGIDVVLVDSDRRGQWITFRCKEIVIFQWHRTPNDEPPYFLPELYWREIDLGSERELLNQLRYSFTDDLGSSMLDAQPLSGTEALWCRFERPLIHIHLEGAICADIVCTDLEIERPSTQNNGE